MERERWPLPRLSPIILAVMRPPQPFRSDPPEPKRKVGFLTRLNPKATPRSVVHRACITCIASAAIWGLCLIFRPNPKWQASWPSFVLWLCCAVLVGAVWEWQVPDEDDEEQPP